MLYLCYLADSHQAQHQHKFQREGLQFPQRPAAEKLFRNARHASLCVATDAAQMPQKAGCPVQRMMIVARVVFPCAAPIVAAATTGQLQPCTSKAR